MHFLFFFKGQGDIRRAGGDRVEVAGIICSFKKVNCYLRCNVMQINVVNHLPKPCPILAQFSVHKT
jgi:hypothetical protein